MAVRKTRNDKDFWYCMYDPTVKYILIDENGNETGEVAPKYGEAIPFWANVSPAIGQAQFEQFGNLGNYDRVIVTRDMTCPVNETAVLFIDKQPEYKEVTAYGLDAIAIAVSKVTVG